MDLGNLEDLERIENYLLEIRGILNPEDGPYICDAIVANISDELLADLIMDMLIRMNYKPKTIKKIIQKVKEIQS